MSWKVLKRKRRRRQRQRRTQEKNIFVKPRSERNVPFITTFQFFGNMGWLTFNLPGWLRREVRKGAWVPIRFWGKGSEGWISYRRSLDIWTPSHRTDPFFTLLSPSQEISSCHSNLMGNISSRDEKWNDTLSSSFYLGEGHKKSSLTLSHKTLLLPL